MAYTAKPSGLPQFGTNTGTNIVTGLTATAAEWQENVTSGLVTYGVIKYTFSGSPDLSSVIAGHVLNVTTGFTNAENKISGLEILEVNNASDWVKIKSWERTDASLDETGVSATSTTITSTAARIYEPSSAKKGQGLLSPEKPSDGLLNWLFNKIYQWLNMLDQNYPTGYLLGEKLTAGPGISISDNGDNTKLITGDGVISTGTITQSSHGFVATNAIYHNGTTWAKAQGNTIATSTDVWIVTSVPTSNTFIAVRAGRVTVASHGLTPGSVYFLSATSAGALTTTRPVGSTTRPLGYFTQLVFVESTSVLHILGGNPQFNPTYAEYVATGNVDLNTLAFSGLSLNNVGGSLRFELSAECDTATVPTARMALTGIGSGNYAFTQYDDSSGTLTRSPSTGEDSFLLGNGDGGSIGDNFTCHGKLMRVNNNEYHLYSEYLQKPDSGSAPETGYVRGRTTATLSNVTEITFANSSSVTRLIAGDYVRLLIDRMPDA